MQWRRLSEGPNRNVLFEACPQAWHASVAWKTEPHQCAARDLSNGPASCVQSELGASSWLMRKVGWRTSKSALRRAPFCKFWRRKGMFRKAFLKHIQVSWTTQKFALCSFTFTKDLYYYLFWPPTEIRRECSPLEDGNCFFTLLHFGLPKGFMRTPLLGCRGGRRPVPCNCCISRPLLSLATKHQTFLFHVEL